ncbi:esterase/lipase family protein [Mycoplasmopsis iners]|uniref:esterase/lipase family protein n=1 Tax=Mycoplasmopsis iners TaxID=76630 RepID=UPI000494E2F4|nr:alpha/beta hydrolase [Mycoplasmopsis iners]
MKMHYIVYKNQEYPILFIDNKSDTTLFMLHGLNSSSDFALPLLPYVKNMNVVAINFPGNKYFNNISPEEITLEWWQEIAELVLDKIKSKHIVMLAHSMGGGVAAKLAENKRIEKVIMLATINPKMTMNKSYSILEKVVAPTKKIDKFVGKIITAVSSKFKKTQGLVETFSRKGAWFNLLEKYVLNPEFMKILDKQYQENANKMVFIIGENDSIIGTENFINYAKELKIFSTIIGTTHSPLKNSAEQIGIFINQIIQKPHKRHFWSKKTKFSKEEKEFKDYKKQIIDDLIDESLN